MNTIARPYPGSRAPKMPESPSNKPMAIGGPISQRTPVSPMAPRAPQPGTDALRKAAGSKRK